MTTYEIIMIVFYTVNSACNLVTLIVDLLRYRKQKLN